MLDQGERRRLICLNFWVVELGEKCAVKGFAFPSCIYFMHLYKDSRLHLWKKMDEVFG